MTKKETEIHNFEKQQRHRAATLRNLWNYSGYLIYPNILYKDQIGYRLFFFFFEKQIKKLIINCTKCTIKCSFSNNTTIDKPERPLQLTSFFFIIFFNKTIWLYMHYALMHAYIYMYNSSTWIRIDGLTCTNYWLLLQ